jgi:hypothetical protein
VNKWTIGADVKLTQRPPFESDEWIWREYSLYLICNRHVPEFMGDDTVSDALRKMRARTPLPYE